MDCIFIGCALNSKAYKFFIHKFEIPNIHVNMIIESRDVFFEVYVQTERNKTSGKRTHKTAFKDEGPGEPTINAEVEPRSKRSRISKFFGPNFVAYALESEPQIFKKATSSTP